MSWLSLVLLLLALVGVAAGAPAPANVLWVRVTLTVTEDPLPTRTWGGGSGPWYFDGALRTLAQDTTGFGGDAPLLAWVLVDWMWSDLEPQDGHYDGTDWDGNPGSTVCPDWRTPSPSRTRTAGPRCAWTSRAPTPRGAIHWGG